MNGQLIAEHSIRAHSAELNVLLCADKIEFTERIPANSVLRKYFASCPRARNRKLMEIEDCSVAILKDV